MIKLINDIEIDLATAHSRLSKHWKNRHWRWSELVNRCAETKRTGETAKEYAKMGRDEQSSVKDVGGFVGGYLSQGTRKTANVMYRTVATLDIDYGTPEVWDDFTMAYNFAAMLYSTHKHCAEKPRYRLVFPLSRQVTPAEYEPICRRIAAEVGIDLFDDTTYELPRLFYWPSTSRDADYVFEYQDGPVCDVDKILKTYINPQDVSEWPVSSREGDVIAHEIKKAGDPTEKPGLIGAFCRAYSIEDVIEQYLSDVYEATAIDGRYTYKLGSVAGGLVCYEGKFAYSHHETDPCSRQLCNAFDLVRIHLYGVQDEGSRVTDITRLPSYNKMQEMASADKKVRGLLAKERKAEASSDFADLEEDEEENTDWMQELEYTKNGKIQSNAKNILTVLNNDPQLKDHLWYDEFSSFDIVKGGLPWNKKAVQWGNRDDANLRIYFEQQYDITGKDKIKDAKDAVLTSHRIHPIREYLNSLEWDGTPRLERLIIDFVGAEDTTLSRAMTRKHFTAAVARIFHPGIKYDYCLILQGEEGIKKSTVLSVMGGEWFNDSITTAEGKEGMEQLRRTWIAELAELSSMKRSDVETIKNYLSRQDDIYRAAYGQVVEKHPRQVVFCGTTNETYFLKGDRGNRRFWIIPVNKDLRKYDSEDLIPALQEQRDQIWAEAVEMYRRGEKLYLTDELEIEARKLQTEFNDNVDDPIMDALRVFLDMNLPADWDAWDLQRRRAHYQNPDPLEADSVMPRERFCIPEFMCEYMRRDITSKEYKYLARKVGKLMENIPDWEKITSTKHAVKLYGVQRGYRKKITETYEDDSDI